MKRKEAIQLAERNYWAELLAKHAGSVPAVAKEAGLHRSGVYHHVRRLGLMITRGNELESTQQLSVSH